MSLLDRFRREPAPPTKARGTSGRGHTHGFLQLEELNRDLQGRMGLEVFDRMVRTDPEVRRNVLMVTNPVVSGTWEVEPFNGDDAQPRDEEAAEFGDWLFFEHMQPDLPGHLREAAPLVVRSGFAPFEHVWGRAQWKGRDVLVPKRLSVRLPRSIFRWPQDAEEQLKEIVQIVPTGELAGERHIPRSALVYYRVGAEGDNWEGQSLLRPVYKPWFYKDKLERLDALGHEREAIGYPFVYPPAGVDTDSEQLDLIDKDIAALRAGEDARVIMPGPHAQDVDEGGWRVDIMGLAGGEGSRDPHPTLQYHKDSIAAAFLAEFMRLGQGQGAVGARATAEEQSNPFEASIEAFVSIFETELNESLLARAVALNFSDVEGPPKLKMSLADGTSLSELATTAAALVTAGLLTPDHDLEDYLRERGDLPPADPEERAKRDAEKEMMREATAKGIKEGTVGPDGKPVPGQGGATGGPVPATAKPGAKTDKNLSSKPKERRTEKEKTVERFESVGTLDDHWRGQPRDRYGRWKDMGVNVDVSPRGALKVTSPFDRELVNELKELGGRWDGAKRVWTVPGKEADGLERALGRVYGDKPGDTTPADDLPSDVTATVVGDRYRVATPYSDDFRRNAKEAGARWNGNDKAWEFPLARRKQADDLARAAFSPERRQEEKRAADAKRTHARGDAPSEKQIGYAKSLLARHHEPLLGDAFPKPSEAELGRMSRSEVSAVIDLLKEDLW